MKAKRIILVFLALAMFLAPVMAQAADVTARTAELSALKLTDISKYDTKIPTGGTKKTEKDLQALWAKYPYKEASKGTTDFTYYLSISKNDNSENRNAAAPKEITDVAKVKNWSKYDEKTKMYSSYREELKLKSGYSDDVGKTVCNLSIEDKNYYYYYTWIKGEKTGTLWKTKKEADDYTPDNPNESANEYMFFKDETVLGELCKVYSIKTKAEGSEWTSYYWLSTVNGKIIKYFYVSDAEYGYYDNAMTYFVDYKLNKPDDFYSVPKNVKFTEEK